MEGDRLQLTARDAARQGLVVPRDQRMSDRFDVVVVGSGAGGGVVAGELAAPRARRPAARGRAPSHGGRLHALGGQGDTRPLVAHPLRAHRRGRGRSRRPGRRPVRRRQHDHQHEGRAPRARPRSREVARGERPRRREWSAVRRERPRPPLRPGRGDARRSRAHGLAEERLHRRARLPGARHGARAGSLLHGRELHALRLVPAGLSDERRQVHAQHLHPRQLSWAAISS